MTTNRREFLSTLSALAIPSSAIARPSSWQNDQITGVSACRLANIIAQGNVSCVEATKAYLDQIDTVNPKINAVVQLADDALAVAEAADRARQRGEQVGPLHGVPFTIKDNIETAGVKTTCGMAELEDYVPKEDAVVVKRLKKAGGIFLGKTNVPEFCLFPDTNNLIYGRTKNPHDLSRITAGSSGGEAANVAACGSAFGIGTDIGGSIRTPSHFCGVAGLKPSSGLVPETGVLNSFPPANWGWNSTGPIARYVEDLALVLSVIADSFELSKQEIRPSKLRVAYFVSNGKSQPENAIQEAVRNAAGHLRELGADVKEDRPDCFPSTSEVWWLNLNPDLGTTFQMTRKEYAKLANRDGISDKYLPVVDLFFQWQKLLVDEGRYGAEQRYEAGRRLHQYRLEMSKFMSKYDILLCPADANVATEYHDGIDHYPPIEETYKIVVEGGNYTQAFNMTGSPVACVPISQTEDNLPVGIQVASAVGRDSLVLQAAQILEERFGGWQRPKAI